MKNLARAYIYWPNIDKQIENFVKTCSRCALAGKSPCKTLLHSWPIPFKPWERIHIDYAEFKTSNFLIIVDAYSKWPEIIRTSISTSSKTISILSSIFSRFGSPNQIVSDNGTQFTSELFQRFCNLNGIEHVRTSPYSPMSNGQAERFVDSFKRIMKKLDGAGNLDENLELFLHNYRITPNENCPSSKSPAELFLNRKIRTIFDLLSPSILSSTTRNLEMENSFNKKHGARSRKFTINDTVYVQIHRNNSWQWEEGVIIAKIGNVNYVVQTENRNVRAHCNNIKKRFQNLNGGDEE